MHGLVHNHADFMHSCADCEGRLMAKWPYTKGYERARAALLAANPVCVHCGAMATEADHQPPVALHVHIEGTGCCVLVPSCATCARRQGTPVAQAKRPDAPQEPDGFDVGHRIWDRAPWLDGLRRVPDNAVWPRLMSAPHPAAVGSVGAEFCHWSQQRSGRPVRWWQQVASYRLLEVDADGRLVWEAVVASMARQLGKSWWLRDLLMWRMHQADRFGEPQLVLHT